uniref:Uncharacterized protein n=1 Tax=Anguilla anguilla TaxID=7936 RepID=A0A0E9R609_ANGAN
MFNHLYSWIFLLEAIWLMYLAQECNCSTQLGTEPIIFELHAHLPIILLHN